MAIIALSGGFDPIHSGHVAMIEDAALIGDVHIILNSDAWLVRKKGYVFQTYNERQAILRSIKGVVSVVEALDDDNTVCKTLELILPDYFGNGGDRTEETTPELELCNKLGIKPVFNLGGGKTQSSSALVADSQINALVERKWGRYKTLYCNDTYKVKLLYLDAGKQLSKQRHKKRMEIWTFLQGEGHLLQGSYTAGEMRRIMYNEWHSAAARTDTVILELQVGQVLDETDIERL